MADYSVAKHGAQAHPWWVTVEREGGEKRAKFYAGVAARKDAEDLLKQATAAEGERRKEDPKGACYAYAVTRRPADWSPSE